MRYLSPFIVSATLLVSVACAAETSAEQTTPRVAVTFSVLGDLVKRVAGEEVHVDVLTPVGAEVHEWELSPSNFETLERADLVFYNGYQLEQWMPQVRSTVSEGVPVIAVAEEADYRTLPIVTGEYEGDADPHLWMAPRAAAAYVKVIADRLGELHGDHSEVFDERAEAVTEALEDLHEEIAKKLEPIPQQQRLLVTSEAAFVYFADAFDFEHDGVWGTNAETEGSPRQIMRIVDLVRERSPAAVFWESTISDRHVKAVADDTGVAIAGPLYVDSLGEAGGNAEDYFSMMRHNARLLRENLVDSIGG